MGIKNIPGCTDIESGQPSWSGFQSTVFYGAGRRLGPEAANLLEQIPDDNLRLFETIELAAALSGVPAASITQMTNPHPPQFWSVQGGRTRDARLIEGRTRIETGGPKMRSPDGRLIRCPKCLFRPPSDFRWNCECGHVWNTFLTEGNCPACHFHWDTTGCPRCGEMSEHRAWYASET